MQVIGKSPDLVPSLIRYVEAKCLVAGVTTSQGIALSSDAAIRKFYKGVVRNTDEPDDPLLKAAPGRIGDVAASGAAKFAVELARDNRLLLHLAEGVDATARGYFADLQLPDGTWAISDHLVGIHSVALQASDIAVVQAHGASMVWSPLSNLLLYGQTADVAEFHRLNVPIGLGSDWSPSGSKNLLGELKAAYWVSRNASSGAIFTDQELVQMVTSKAAQILDWRDSLGSVEAGKLADLIAIKGTSKYYNQALIRATERDVVLTMIGGIGCAGRPDLISPFTSHGETVKIGGEDRLLNFDTSGADPIVKPITLAKATKTMKDALHNLPQLAAAFPAGELAAAAAPKRGEMTLALDEIEDTGQSLRLNPKHGFDAIPSEALLAAQPPLTDILVPLELDALTAIDDPTFFHTLLAEQNLPAYLAPNLAQAYGAP
jgi:hypothetical protein